MPWRTPRKAAVFNGGVEKAPDKGRTTAKV